MAEEYSIDQAEEAEVEQQIQSAEPEMIPVGIAQHPELTKWQEDPQDIFVRFKHGLMGETFNITKGIWEKVKVKNVHGIVEDMPPVMNDEGIQYLMFEIDQYSNKSVYLSNLGNEEVYNITRNFSNNITQTLFNNGERFGIDWQRAFQSNLVDNASDIVFFSLQRALNQGERTWLGSHTRILHRIDETQRPEKQKKFGIF